MFKTNICPTHEFINSTKGSGHPIHTCSAPSQKHTVSSGRGRTGHETAEHNRHIWNWLGGRLVDKMSRISVGLLFSLVTTKSLETFWLKCSLNCTVKLNIGYLLGHSF